jgi:hypothetical protein
MARPAPAAHLCLRVGPRYEVAFVPFPARPPMFVIGTGSALISVTLPEQLKAGHVDFARQLAAKAWGYAVAVERSFRGLPPLPDGPVPSVLSRWAGVASGVEPDQGDLVPLSGGREVTA